MRWAPFTSDLRATYWLGIRAEATSNVVWLSQPQHAKPSCANAPLRHLAIALGAARADTSTSALAVLEAALAARAAGVEFLTLCLPSPSNQAQHGHLQHGQTQHGQTQHNQIQGAVLLFEGLAALAGALVRAGIRVRVLGDLAELPNRERRPLEALLGATRRGARMTLTLMRAQDRRSEIVDTARALAIRVQAGLLLPEEIDEATFRAELGTHDLPEVDLLIEFGGHCPINELLLETRNAEFVRARVPFTALGRLELKACVRHYNAARLLHFASELPRRPGQLPNDTRVLSQVC